MKTIIDGKLYDTSVAQQLAQTDWKIFGWMGDPVGWDREIFYKTQNGAYFKLYEQAALVTSFYVFVKNQPGEVRRQCIYSMNEKCFIDAVYASTGKYLGEPTPA